MRNTMFTPYIFAINLIATSIFMLALATLIHLSVNSYTAYIVATAPKPVPPVVQAVVPTASNVKACTTEQAIQWWIGSGRDLKAAKKEFCKS